MARIQFADIISAMSGSVGGATYSRNRYGAYKRLKAMPVNPKTALQQTVRNIFGSLSQRWQSLTPAQRTAWKIFADSVVLMPGQNRLDAMPEFIRCNAARQQAGLALIDDAPTTFVNAEAPNAVSTVPTITVASGLSLAYDNTHAALGEVGGAFLIFMGPPREATQNHRKGFRYVGKIAGAGTPPTSPFVVAAASLPYLPVAGKKNWIRVVAVRADGRVSTEIVKEDEAA